MDEFADAFSKVAVKGEGRQTQTAQREDVSAVSAESATGIFNGTVRVF